MSHNLIMFICLMFLPITDEFVSVESVIIIINYMDVTLSKP